MEPTGSSGSMSTALPIIIEAYDNFAASEVRLALEKYLMPLKDSVPAEYPKIFPEVPSFFPMQQTRFTIPPLPALAKEVLWYTHEKRFQESHNIPLSPFITRYQKLFASAGNNVGKTPSIYESFVTLWIQKDLQDAKHKRIARLVHYQIKKFEDAYESYDNPRIKRQFEGSIWFDESYDDAIIDYYDAHKDRIELDDLRAKAWKAGARWRHAELLEFRL